jgi:ATP-dependent exoDNAse (exonuclease V) beta subunit
VNDRAGKDSEARRLALDVTRSFIVQAPAGSGKTELLSQRFLALLAHVEKPEEVLAITFTRKAAAEMRRRVLGRLHQAAQGGAVSEPHLRVSLDLAREALLKDRELGWQLLDCPFRLRIMTIDALNASLVRRMPMATGLPATIQVSETPRELYLQAGEAMLNHLGEPGVAADQVERLLVHLDNSPARFVGMIADMLSRRDHWLRHVVSSSRDDGQRQQLEADLAATITEELRRHAARVPRAIGEELCALAKVAAARLDDAGIEHRLDVLDGLTGFPAPKATEIDKWHALSDLVLTKTRTLRKTVNKRNGFPPEDRPVRQRMLDLLEQLRATEGFEDAFAAISSLPGPMYPDEQWEVLEALFGLLPLAAAELELLCDERGETDYTGLAFAAGRTLGHADAPEDLALLLDYQLRHILVDEFQDTSVGQVEMLSRLCAGWEEGDGRTFFCVGDPMQSIYRFRDADVGLFLSARRGGLALPRLHPLALDKNFRSVDALIGWFNATFPRVLAERENATLGAVPYTPSTVGSSEASDGPAVRMYPIAEKSDDAEARAVADIAATETGGNSGGTCAILVRSRTHLAAIVRELRTRGIPFQAVEIEALGSQPHVCDLLALTRALVHRGDRLAWLSLLRAPFVGLSLADLAAVAEDEAVCIAEQLLCCESLPGLSSDGKARALKLAACLRRCDDQRGRRGLRRWIEGAWLELGGAATLANESCLGDVEAFFTLLDSVDAGGDLEDHEVLDARLVDLFASPDSRAGDNLQIMTIHKAKGLEFDSVILPGLHRRPRGGNKPLLRWMEISGEDADTRLLLAPISPHGEAHDPLSRYLGEIDTARAKFETGRLLYVAATRARTRLHLVFGLKVRNDGGGFEDAISGSLLWYLWPQLSTHLMATNLGLVEAAGSANPTDTVPGWRRLRTGWKPPPPQESVRMDVTPRSPARAVETVEFDWAGEAIRRVGTVVHRYLQRITVDGPGKWDEKRLQREKPAIEASLRDENMPETRLESARERVITALRTTLASDRGRWLLDPAHDEASAELRLSGILDGHLTNVIIDRTFRDAEGRRWIIDYKTSSHEGGDRKDFLDREAERYRRQLERYADLLSGLYPGQPIALGLYFPLLDGWRSWRYSDASGI